MREKIKREADMAMMIVCVSIAGIVGGGYFLSVSALLGLILLSIILYRILWKRKIKLAVDLNLAAFSVLAFSHLTVSLWAIDSGMAALGFVKFLPLLLFYIYASGEKEKREQVIMRLPLLGCLMTVFSFVMMQFPIFEEWVSVAGRLAGFFQYPNTYALFMLICLIIVFYRFDAKHLEWLDMVYALAALFGIYMSGSRTVLVLTVLAVTWMVVSHKEMRKISLIVIGAGSVVLAGVVLLGNSVLLSRLTSMNSSTLLGRILYAKDALPVIIKHPFGLGYYGYYFIQQSIQTGVYSVVNVHNELLQMLLDVGIIPTVLMCAAVVRSVIAKNVNKRNQLILIVMILHSLFDYDFQFLIMGFVLILFLDIKNVKQYNVPILTRSVLGLACMCAAVFTIVTGISDVCYTTGKYEKAFRMYGGNTMAEIELLSKADTAGKMKEIANSLIEKNKYISVAYSARARAEFAEGNVGEFIDNKLEAIRLAPYQYGEYVDYLEILAYCESMYLKSGSEEDAAICVQRAEEIPILLKITEEKTSDLAWKIKDKPQVTLKSEHLEMIRRMRRDYNL